MYGPDLAAHSKHLLIHNRCSFVNHTSVRMCEFRSSELSSRRIEPITLSLASHWSSTSALLLGGISCFLELVHWSLRHEQPIRGLQKCFYLDLRAKPHRAT